MSAIEPNRQTLPNGLTVYVIENPQIPLVTLDMWVKVGSKDEPAEIAGISHYIEHMLFKGTERLAVGDYDRRIEEMGGYLNAATSGDYTHYFITVPSEKLEAAMEDMADVLLNSTFDPKELEQERMVILEEIRMKKDQPIGFLYDEIVRSVYDSSPYENTVIGSSETVSKMTRDQLMDHYQRYYTPDNMAFIVSGNVKQNDLMKLVNRHFSEFTRDRNPHRSELPETVFSRVQDQVWQKEWQQTYFFFTMPGYGLTSLEIIARDSVVEQILSGGRSARLVKALREDQGLVTSISLFGPNHREPGFWGVYGTCEWEKIEEVKTAVQEELQRVVDEGLTSTELKRAKKSLVTDHLYQMETNAGKASILGHSFALLDSDTYYEDYPSAVEKVTEADVIETVRNLLQQDMSSFVARPEDLIPASVQ